MPAHHTPTSGATTVHIAASSADTLTVVGPPRSRPESRVPTGGPAGTRTGAETVAFTPAMSSIPFLEERRGNVDFVLQTDAGDEMKGIANLTRSGATWRLGLR